MASPAIVAYLHVWRAVEIEPAAALLARFPTLRPITWLPGRLEREIIIPRAWMTKRSISWTRQFLTRFLAEDAQVVAKIDPDTTVVAHDFPLPDCHFDVAGDFRTFNGQWLFMGGYQVFTRKAAETLLVDPLFTGPCQWQDLALGQAIQRLGLVAFNMPNVNAWTNAPAATDAVCHPCRGHTALVRSPAGIVDLS